MPTTRLSRVAAIGLHCRNCIYDPDPRTPGTWREQVAACAASNCALHSVRPVPRNCWANGVHDPVAIGAIRAKLDRSTRQDAANR